MDRGGGPQRCQFVALRFHDELRVDVRGDRVEQLVFVVEHDPVSGSVVGFHAALPVLEARTSFMSFALLHYSIKFPDVGVAGPIVVGNLWVVVGGRRSRAFHGASYVRVHGVSVDELGEAL